MDALDVIIESQGWAPNVTLGLLRRFINGRGLNAECARFLQNIADAENDGAPATDIPVEPRSDGQTLRLSVDLSFGGGRIDSHHIRMSVHNAICQLATEGAITPDHEDHAILKSWSLTAASAEEA